MPQSLVTRISPGRDLRSEDHKRRYSLESAISRREKDDELALFNEAQSKERDNFLLQSNEDFDDDIFSTKLRYFLDHKVEISVPARKRVVICSMPMEIKTTMIGWSITPPETPLFRSMDDEGPPQVKPADRTHPGSQPVPISRSPTTEKASSGDDDLDSLRSLPISSSGRSGPRGVDIYPSKSPDSFSRKPGRSLSNSATKRSLDLVRQVDRKGHQNMFRPLLSRVPISTSHAENENSQHYSLSFEHSSSITTRSITNSDLATSGAHDIEKSIEQNQDNMKGHSYPYMDDELFVMEQSGKLNEVLDEIDVKNDCSDATNSSLDMVTCSKCGQLFLLDEVVIEEDPLFCRECKNPELNSNITNPELIPTTNPEKVDESQHSSFELIKNLRMIPTKEKGFNYPKCVNNARGHIFENTSFTTSNTSFSLNSTKSSISMSFSSSFDLGFSRETEGRVYQQSSGQKSDTENYQYEFDEKTCLDPCEQLLASECTEMSEISACTNIENNVVLKTQEGDAGPDSLCADGVDVAEVPYTGPLDAIYEIEIENVDGVISADSGSDVDSIDLRRCTDDLRDDEDITEIVDEFDVSQPNHRVIDESRILLDEEKSKSRTLEEATDAILFCSSIVHNTAYEAANIAIYKETSPIEVIRPTVTYLEKPDRERRDNNYYTFKDHAKT
ncbi:hypothetical protein CASFOL_020322 [Castilleja foliolosa]|uniref:Uncharacterized protein n=1 Tax=Castilleja foliolosa TaxID=1961234 RepID=A0ABD3D0I3_9LAMI